ncbi:MAG: ATP-binding cassette domain-containing protein [Thermoplasmata archaeon]|jgi:ABC-2 type transport system ATP-binding protein|nr:ATP-binding cassette domain-containing protein [Thermoplasmata archaeon]
MKKGNAIELKNVSKSFRLEVMSDKKGKLGKNKTVTTSNVVFENLSLEVKKGEVLGVLGRNGSGKSTLLSIMAKILEPDSGTVEVEGKVASILALGMGFHGEMSGRENIYLKGELYGFSRKEMDEKVEEIIDFTGIRKYIDNPLKTYSSGMSGRLAFAIMLHVNADVMLVDEVLSTGDASYSAKASTAFKKIMKQGKTVVFVSHNMSAVTEMCSRVIWIEKGKIVAEGKPKVVCAKYTKALSESYDVVYDQALSGVASAQYRLAMMYRDGKDVEKDDEQYKEWMKKAADQGHVDAQVAYADILYDSGTEEDLSEALILYQSAADKGNSSARMKVSSFAGSNESDPDRAEILEICRAMAESGNPSDVTRYAAVLLKTAWNEEDRKKAYEKYMEASEDGNPDVYYQLAIMRRDGIGTKKSTDGYLEMLHKAAEAGHLKSMSDLATMYQEGKLLEPDEKKAFRWHMKAARNGSVSSQYRVACMYRDGEGVEMDKEKSEKWFHIYSHAVIAQYQMVAADVIKFRPGTDADPDELITKAAMAYNPRAITALASIYASGSNRIADKERAKQCYLKAAEQPGTPRMILGDMYYEGRIFDQDFAKAAEMYLSCSYVLDLDRCYRMYLMFKDGIGVEKDMAEAKKYLKRAAAKGHREARRILGLSY